MSVVQGRGMMSKRAILSHVMQWWKGTRVTKVDMVIDRAYEMVRDPGSDSLRAALTGAEKFCLTIELKRGKQP